MFYAQFGSIVTWPICSQLTQVMVIWYQSIIRIRNENYLDTLRPRQDGRRFSDDTFECIFLKENVIILIKISLKFVPNGPIDNITELVQIMAWRRPGDKPLSESMMVRLPTHICATLPQWVNIAEVKTAEGIFLLSPNNLFSVAVYSSLQLVIKSSCGY